MTDRLTDDEHTEGLMHGKILLFSHTLTMMESDIASLVEFHSVV